MSNIDIVIPNYNYGHYLERSVSSVLNQEIDDIRIIIIDNASTDNSVEVAHQLAARDQRISVSVHDENLGALTSMNEGIEWAEADYFMMLTADDVLTRGSLKRAQAVLDNNPDVVFAYGPYVSFYDSDPVNPLVTEDQTADWRFIEGREYIERCCESIVQVVSPLVRTPIQKQVHYRESAYYLADLEVFMRLASFGRVAETDAIQALQGLHNANISQAIWKDPLCNFQASEDMLKSFFSTEGQSLTDAAALYRQSLKNLGKRAYWSGISHFMRGNYKSAYRLFGFSYNLRPASFVFPPINYLGKYKDLEHRAKNAFSLPYVRKKLIKQK